MGRTAAFTLNPLGILGFVCFNARNSYNRIFRHCREAETQLSGRSAARRGVPPVPQPHGAEGLPEPRAHLPPSLPPARLAAAPAPAPVPAAPAPSPAPPRYVRTAGPGRAASSSVRPRSRSSPAAAQGAAIPGSRGPGLGRAARVTRAARWRRDSRSAGNPGGAAPAADVARNTPLYSKCTCSCVCPQAGGRSISLIFFPTFFQPFAASRPRRNCVSTALVET